MKKKAKDTNDTPQNILCDVASGCSRSAAGQMPNSAALKKTIRRTRAQVSHVPVVPSSLNELDLPAVYCKTEKGADFLLYDSGSTSSNDRILVFGTNENLNFLQNSKHWFADGTFKTSPNLFTQLYTIHAIVKNENVPVLFALLPSKIDYFEDTWIGRIARNGRRREPLFPIEMWNCFSSVVDGLPKTNNSIEGWHRHFSSLLGAHHPSVWKCIKFIKKEQSYSEGKMEQLVAGREGKKKLRKYEDCADRISRIVERLRQ
ncbi:hypothetical protein JTE90_015533 [Oedothorax gibbosus]|uniref:MULE transposase domain-containing protein n=1 Tax=Oedothorax gibbosus TaxID=931172 RepID=A0AAV6TP44_9ARAC|nr:hypothetical protein JTE90_015533 [Oedothorax gibbosus]